VTTPCSLVYGLRKDVSVGLVDAHMGYLVLVHAGIAIGTLDELA